MEGKEVVSRRAMDELPEFSEVKKVFLGAPGNARDAKKNLRNGMKLIPFTRIYLRCPL